MKNFFIALLTIFFTTLGFLLCSCATKTAQDCIASGKIDKAKDFFTNKASINEVDKNGETALHVAAKKNESDLVAFLVVKGADTEIKNKNGDTALQVAINNNSYESARVLTSLGADIFALDSNENSALENALAKGKAYYDIMINAKTSELHDANNGNGIVHYFVITENKKAIDYCIEKQLDIDKKNSAGETPLELALENPQTLVGAEIAASLIIAGAGKVECDAEYFEDAVAQRDYSVRLNDGQTPIHLATIYGHNGIIQYLLKNGADITAQDISGATPLHEAVRYGNVETVRYLIANGANVNAKDRLGKTPLLVLIPTEKQKEIYSLLIANGADVNHKDMYGDTVLHTASMVSLEDEIIEKFITVGANVNMRNKKGVTPIAASIEHENARQVNYYATHGADIHAADANNVTPFLSVLDGKDDLFKALVVAENASAIDSDGNTPLIVALKRDAPIEKIEHILSFGVNINARNRNGESALYVAVEKNNRRAGEILLGCNADIFATNTKDISPLRLALESQNGSEQWILNSRTINARDGGGNTVLHYAAEWKLPKETLELVIQKGYDVNAVNANGETPLFSAAKSGNVNAINVLADNSADIDICDNLGSSPLHTAVRWNSLASAETLISRGSYVDCQNVAGKSPLYEAAIGNNVSMAKLLLSNRADPNIHDANGVTALIGTVRANHDDMAKCLLAAGANPHSQDLNGITALHEAANLGNVDTIKILRSAGANPLARDKGGNTPFSITFNQESAVMYAVLGNDKTISDSEGNTPVHIAVQKNARLSVLKSLIAKGYSLDARNSDGYTPLAVAISSSKKDEAIALLENGANPFVEINSKGENAVSLSFKEPSGELLSYVVKYAGKKTDTRGNGILHYAARFADKDTVNRLLSFGLDKEAKNVSNETPYNIAMNWKNESNAALLQ